MAENTNRGGIKEELNKKKKTQMKVGEGQKEVELIANF